MAGREVALDLSERSCGTGKYRLFRSLGKETYSRDKITFKGRNFIWALW